ncbi:cytochrome P450 [Dentipellis sp. KUC8613]|nr:cytochrome P450 [Dentipellis sp. KUC8613]
MVSIHTAVLSGTILVLTFLVSRFRKRRTLPYPPSLPGLPLLGNYLSLPTQRPWATYAQWSKALQSDLISINVFGQVMVVINSKKVARELLDNRSAKYSDRPQLVMIGLTGFDFHTGLMPYSDKWRAKRRLLHETLHGSAALAYRPLQKAKTHELLRKLHHDPSGFMHHIRSLAASVAMTVSYGDLGDERQNERSLLAAQGATEMISEVLIPGAFAVDTLPFLRHLPGWLPGMGFKALAQICTKRISEMKDLPWAIVKQNMDAHVASPSMASKMLERIRETSAGPDAEEIAKDACAVTYIAGADTSVSAMTTAVLALLLHPEIQHRAQKEIDGVVGRHRLPTYEDRGRLPYVEAIYREVLRWNPVFPLSVAHAAFEDDVYSGYFIPKGTPILPNVWAMTHDPVEYPEPESFKPERFLTPEGKVNGDDMQVMFGFGRRVCSGQHLADATVWMMIASTLALFRLVAAKDEDGNEITAKVEYTDGLVSHPRPFDCMFEPRNREAEMLLAQLHDAESIE